MARKLAARERGTVLHVRLARRRGGDRSSPPASPEDLAISMKIATPLEWLELNDGRTLSWLRRRSQRRQSANGRPKRSTPTSKVRTLLHRFGKKWWKRWRSTSTERITSLPP